MLNTFLISSFQFLLAVLSVFLLVASNSASEEHKWHSPAAESCFQMLITRPPTDPLAGIVAIVPDGALLPKNQFKVEVFTSRGQPLKHEFLWHNPKEGLAVVFEPTEDENVFLYVSPSPEKMRFASSFRPSLLLYVRSGNASLELSHALADKPPVGDDIYFAVVESIFHSLSPAGRDDNVSSYYTGWFNVKRPGRTYFYTLSKDGSEFFIDGKFLYSWPGIHDRSAGASAQKGAWLDLTAGAHRVEYFHFNTSLLMREAQLGWQLPGTQPSADPKAPPGVNLDLVGPLQPDDFVHSGRTELIDAFSKKGPLAIFYPVWESIIQPGKDPVCLFRFEPFGAETLPEAAVCSWDFGRQRILKGRSVRWLFGGAADQKVSLNISIGGHNSTATRFFFPKSFDLANDPPRVSIFTPQGRAEYRAVYQTVVSATPKEKRPCEDWNETMWEGFLAVLDQQTGSGLLSEVIERSLPDLKRLDSELRWKIEDRVIEIARCSAPQKALEWIDIFEKEEKDSSRITHWKAKKIELALYELNDLELARQYARSFVDGSADKYASVLSLVRLGDVERFSNNFEAARLLYTKAQELYALASPPAKSPPITSDPRPAAQAPGSAGQAPPERYAQARALRPGESPKAPPSQEDSAGAKTETALRKLKEQVSEAVKSSAKAGLSAPAIELPAGEIKAAPQSVSDWKVTAVRGAGYYATVKSFIDQDAYEEARSTLFRWELEFPLTKLTGDYLPAEALYYIALNNYRAAVRILANYRGAVEISNELPMAMRMELYCLTKLPNDAEARAFARTIIERLPSHELADEIRNLLARDDSRPLVIDFDIHSRAWTASEKVDSSILTRLFDTNQVYIIEDPDEYTPDE